MLARLARLFTAALLLAGWQAALHHSIDHAAAAHDETALCAVLDALGACAPQASIVGAVAPPVPGISPARRAAPIAADTPPFLAQGPPLQVGSILPT